LQWGDIDLDKRTIRVNRSLEETKAGLRLKEPKTKCGRRTIELTQPAIDVLRAHKLEQMKFRLAVMAPKLEATAPVFCTIEGKLMSPDNLSRDWRRTIIAKKLPPVSFHALRHTHASMLIASGLDILKISRLLGHSKASVTLDVYGHLMPTNDRAAARAIEEALK
jgi:integrase